MIKIQVFEVNPIQENCYVVSDETKNCMIVDCGAFYAEEFNAIYNYISENGLTPVLQVLTHAHLDHAFGTYGIFTKYGLKPFVCYKDEKQYNDLPIQARELFRIKQEITLPPVGKYVKNGDTLKVGNTEWKVIETPGHTEGSVFIYSEDNKTAFSGDTLFRGSIGRTDLPGGSMFQIIQSLRMITQLPDDTRILPGHGPETTMGFECETNMYLER